MSVVVHPRETEHRYTAEEFEQLPAEWRYELIEGSLRDMGMPTGDLHGTKTVLLTLYLMQHIVENSLGDGFAAETGFLIHRSPDTIKAPDFAFVQRARLNFPRGGGAVPVVPDLVLETRSPSDRAGMVQTKIQEWLDAGVRLVLDLDPARRLLIVCCPDAPPITLTPTDTLEGDDVLPGFALPLTRLFPEHEQD